MLCGIAHRDPRLCGCECEMLNVKKVSELSFAAQTKKELTLIESKACCSKAELAALIRMNGTIQLSRQRVHLDVSTENAAIARRIYTLIKQLYKLHVELLVRKKMRLKKNNVYIVRIPNQVEELLAELHIV